MMSYMSPWNQGGDFVPSQSFPVKREQHAQNKEMVGHMLHRGNELIEISFLEKSWLPPKKMHYQSGPALKAGTARKGGRGHKVAPGSCQATGHLASRQHCLPCTVWLRDIPGSRITVHG